MRLLDIYSQSPEIGQLSELLGNHPARIRIQGLVGSLSAVFGASIARLQNQKTIVFITGDKEQAFYFCNDMETLFGENELELDRKNILLFPASSRKPYQPDDTENSNVLLRSEVLNRLSSGRHPVIVTYPDALSEKVLSSKTLSQNTLQISTSDKRDIDDVLETLMDFEFSRVDFVVEPGQFALRGGIIDVFSFANEHPFRIEFSGDGIESIRSFDPISQLSIQKFDKITVIPNIDRKKSETSEEKVILLDYLSDNGIIFTENLALTAETLQKNFAKATEIYTSLNSTVARQKPEELFADERDFLRSLLRNSTVEFGTTQFFPEDKIITVNSDLQPAFNKKFDLLTTALGNYSEQSFTNFICVENKQQLARLQKIFGNEKKDSLNIEFLDISLSHGFIDNTRKLLCFTDHEIFERYHKYKVKDFRDARECLTMKELFELKPGDFIVHIDHGVGRFSGLEKIEINNKTQEAIRLVFRDNSLLYISIHSLHKISRYVGKDGVAPKLDRLGSSSWKVLKQKTKQRVKDIAKDLIKLYAERKASKGFAFSADSYLQNELEASFLYEDTPDQSKATRDVKADMEASVPMDRLVCGDVGFGKTEVAIRAAFKAVCDSKQVAVLVPTTILAMQHYNTFKDRLDGMPCNIEYINRFRSTKEKNEIYRKLADGKIDILIGTHAITNAKVKFKDLGLLIIDEEQKFGVSVKEKLRQMKVNVDSLTLTATPIPRTLQFSLMGARDLSVINTAPTNRQPIQTVLEIFSEETIRDAIMQEMSRGGQVFFVSNRVEHLDGMASLVQKLIPDARIGIGHGQMDGERLENVMLDFINGDIDVFVSTTIVENGLDIPNANTIIINNAQNFGLSDLHQLRGRVGRSNKKAFCYLLIPSFTTLTDDARQRLRAIEEFSNIGSGFNIAMRDLDIRGAGNILGAEQSGFISEIGYDMYHKILNEAIDELKNTEFRELYAEQIAEDMDFVKECTIQTDLEVLIPDDYVSNIRERVALYKELNELETDEQLEDYKLRLKDRFGPLPQATEELVETIKLRRLAKEIGVEKLILRENRMTCNFVTNPQNPFYQSDSFAKVITYVQRNPETCHMKETQEKLSLTFNDVNTLGVALQLLENVMSGN